LISHRPDRGQGRAKIGGLAIFVRVARERLAPNGRICLLHRRELKTGRTTVPADPPSRPEKTSSLGLLTMSRSSNPLRLLILRDQTSSTAYGNKTDRSASFFPGFRPRIDRRSSRKIAPPPRPTGWSAEPVCYVYSSMIALTMPGARAPDPGGHSPGRRRRRPPARTTGSWGLCCSDL